MTDLGGFVMTLVGASAASALAEGLLPEGGMKKYVKYIASLVILLLLLTPFASLIGSLPEMAAGTFDYDAVEAMTRVNAIVALHIERAVCEKFGIPDADAAVDYADGCVTVRVRQRFGLFKTDIARFVSANFGVEAEVMLYE